MIDERSAVNTIDGAEYELILTTKATKVILGVMAAWKISVSGS